LTFNDAQIDFNDTQFVLYYTLKYPMVCSLVLNSGVERTIVCVLVEVASSLDYRPSLNQNTQIHSCYCIVQH